MLTTLFGELIGGRLGRWSFFKALVVLSACVLLVVLGIGAAIGAFDHVIAGDVEGFRLAMGRSLGPGATIFFGVAMVLAALAALNLLAKRLRDTGVPGWLSVLGLVALGVALAWLVAGWAALALLGVTSLALLVLPTGSLARRP